MRAAGGTGDRWGCSLPEARSPAREGTCEKRAVTRRNRSEPDLAHVDDPSSADPARRRPRGRDRHQCGDVTASPARPLDRANEPCRVALSSFDDVHHLVFNPLPWRHDRSGGASDRSGRAGSVSRADRPSPEMSKGSRTVLAPRSATWKHSSSHPLLSDEIHPGLRRQFVPNEFPRDGFTPIKLRVIRSARVSLPPSIAPEQRPWSHGLAPRVVGGAEFVVGVVPGGGARDGLAGGLRTGEAACSLSWYPSKSRKTST